MNSSTQKEQIRDLQDLVERVSGGLPLPGKCTENAKTQYKRLRGVSFSQIGILMLMGDYQNINSFSLLIILNDTCTQTIGSSFVHLL